MEQAAPILLPLSRTFRSGDVEVLFLGRGGPREVDDALADRMPRGVVRAWLKQVHGSSVCEAQPGLVGEGDALLVTRPALAAVVVTADCVPVLLAYGERVAAVHAGWRGIAQGIVGRAVAALMRGDPSSAEGCRAWIGPAIGACCYEVSDEVAAQVTAASDERIARPGPHGRPYLDLQDAVGYQLRARGIADVAIVDTCTRCDLGWCSYRRDGPHAGRNFAAIWRRPPGSEA